MRTRKHKQLYRMVEDKGAVSITAQVNLSTMKTTILTIFNQGSKGDFKGKRYPAKPVGMGMARHHIAYHFDDPLKGIVVMPQGQHNHIHSFNGMYGGEVIKYA